MGVETGGCSLNSEKGRSSIRVLIIPQQLTLMTDDISRDVESVGEASDLSHIAEIKKLRQGVFLSPVVTQ